MLKKKNRIRIVLKPYFKCPKCGNAEKFVFAGRADCSIFVKFENAGKIGMLGWERVTLESFKPVNLLCSGCSTIFRVKNKPMPPIINAFGRIVDKGSGIFWQSYSRNQKRNEK